MWSAESWMWLRFVTAWGKSSYPREDRFASLAPNVVGKYCAVVCTRINVAWWCVRRLSRISCTINSISCNNRPERGLWYHYPKFTKMKSCWEREVDTHWKEWPHLKFPLVMYGVILTWHMRNLEGVLSLTNVTHFSTKVGSRIREDCRAPTFTDVGNLMPGDCSTKHIKEINTSWINESPTIHTVKKLR